jgi:hypothetical protein
MAAVRDNAGEQRRIQTISEERANSWGDIIDVFKEWKRVQEVPFQSSGGVGSVTNA